MDPTFEATMMEEEPEIKEFDEDDNDILGDEFTKQRRDKLRNYSRIEIKEDTVNIPNIAKYLDKNTLSWIGSIVVDDYKCDLSSLSEWLNDYHIINGLLRLENVTRNTPFSGAANVKYPLVAQAVITFAANAYPSILNHGKPVTGKVIGVDKNGKKRERANRVEDYLNYKVMNEIKAWGWHTRRSLFSLPAFGCAYKKVFIDRIEQQPLSVMIPGDSIIYDYWCESIDQAPSVSHVYYLSANEVLEFIRTGAFLDVDLGDGDDRIVRDGNNTNKSKISYSEDKPYRFIEQHRWLDLDHDGYYEPWICTVHEETEQVVRIKARWRNNGIWISDRGTIIKIKPKQYFNYNEFFPSFDGGNRGTGFGYLLSHMNNAVNTIVNEILDAGRLQNCPGGFRKSGTQGGDIPMEPGVFNELQFTGDDIRKVLWTPQFQGPSNVLFSMLGMIVEAAEKFSSTSNVMTGQEPRGSNTPVGTILSLIEQGMKVYTSIYEALYESFSREYRMIRDICAEINSGESGQIAYGDQNNYIESSDLDQDGMTDVVPSADPKVATDVQRLQRAAALLEWARGGRSAIPEVDKRYLIALGIEDVDNLIPNQPPPDLKAMIETEKINLEKQKLQLDVQRAAMEYMKAKAEVLEIHARAINYIADAEAKEQGPQIEIYKAQLQSLGEQYKQSEENSKSLLDIIGQQEGMRNQGSEEQSNDVTEGISPGNPPTMAGGGVNPEFSGGNQETALPPNPGPGGGITP